MNVALFLIHIANTLPQKAGHIQLLKKCFSWGFFFLFFPHNFFGKKTKETCYMGPGNNYFLGYGLWFSLATVAGLLLLRFCAADCKSQAAM